MTDLKENPLHLSWHDSAWIPHLNPTNILDYFSERSNPFYDRTCNNEIVKMQKLNIEQLQNMIGLEYILLHVQEPILFVIRKQHRYSANQVTPMADYYIIAGYVYQAPDLNSFISSRLSSGMHHLLSAFEEAHGYVRYHPTKGYTFDFARDSPDKDALKLVDKKREKQKEESSSVFQRARVDLLLGELMKKFPPKMVSNARPTNDSSTNKSNGQSSSSANGNGVGGVNNGGSAGPVGGAEAGAGTNSNGNEDGIKNAADQLTDKSDTSNGTQQQNGVVSTNVFNNNRSSSGIPEKKARIG